MWAAGRTNRSPASAPLLWHVFCFVSSTRTVPIASAKSPCRPDASPLAKDIETHLRSSYIIIYTSSYNIYIYIYSYIIEVFTLPYKACRPLLQAYVSSSRRKGPTSKTMPLTTTQKSFRHFHIRIWMPSSSERCFSNSSCLTTRRCSLPLAPHLQNGILHGTTIHVMPFY